RPIWKEQLFESRLAIEARVLKNRHRLSVSTIPPGSKLPVEALHEQTAMDRGDFGVLARLRRATRSGWREDYRTDHGQVRIHRCQRSEAWFVSQNHGKRFAETARDSLGEQYESCTPSGRSASAGSGGLQGGNVLGRHEESPADPH